MINSTFNPSHLSEFDKSKLQVNIQGLQTTFTAGTTTIFDFKLLDDHLFTGGIVSAKDSMFGDSISMQVIDIDNMLGYGNNFVIHQFVTNWYIIDDSQKQLDFQNEYPAKIFAGLYIRVLYNSIGAINGKLAANFYLHKVMI